MKSESVKEERDRGDDVRIGGEISLGPTGFLILSGVLARARRSIPHKIVRDFEQCSENAPGRRRFVSGFNRRW